MLKINLLVWQQTMKKKKNELGTLNIFTNPTQVNVKCSSIALNIMKNNPKLCKIFIHFINNTKFIKKKYK